VLVGATEPSSSTGCYSRKDYGIGPAAYANWKGAVKEHGSGHGNWWNATVWWECRNMASGYFAEISSMYDDLRESACELSTAYADIAGILGKLRDKEMDAGNKTELLQQVEMMEQEAIEAAAAFAGLLRSGEEARQIAPQAKENKRSQG